jgi:hypothetical protein
MPCLGDVLAYKLLEIGADFQPAVSEVRCGRYETGKKPAHVLRKLHTLYKLLLALLVD